MPRRGRGQIALSFCAGLAGACADHPVDRCEVLAGLCEPALSRSFGIRPTVMAAEDLDGDGLREMLWTTPHSGLALGWGGQTQYMQIGADQRPVDVESIDLDGDGVLEVLVLHQTPPEFEAFRLMGPRKLESIGVWALAGLPHRFAVADVDADGRADVVVAHSRPGGLTTLTQGFATSLTVEFGVDIVDVAVTDLDGNGSVEALAVDVAMSSLHVLEDFTRPGLVVRRSLDTLPAPELVKVVDFDVDGQLDVVTAGRAQASLAVHHGDGTGRLSLGESVATGTADSLGFALVPGEGQRPWLVTAEPDRLTAAQVLDDGSLAGDVPLSATANIETVQQRGESVIYAGVGFVSRIQVSPGLALHERWRDRAASLLLTPTQLASGDFDGDGLADLVLAQADQLQLYLGTDDDTLVAGQLIAATTPSGNLLAADLTGDGLTDLILGQLGPAPALQLAMGRPDGTFELAAPIETDNRNVVLATIDTDGDGVHAVVVGAGNRGTFEGCEVLHFASVGDISARDLPGVPGVVEAVQAVDLDLDGNEDLVALTRGASDIKLVTTHAQGLLGWDPPVSRLRTTVAGTDVTETMVLGLGVGDVDDDEWPDALVTHKTGVEAFLAIDSDEVTSVVSALELDESPVLVSLADLDEDGVMDLLYAGRTVIVAARGGGGGQFMEVLRQQTSTGAATRLPTSDGPPELAVADEFGLAVVNLGPGPAADRPASYGSLGKIVRMKVGDLDADGLPDMIVGSEGVEGSSWGVAVLWNSADGLFNRGLVTTIQALGFTSADMDAREGDELIAIDEEGRVQLHYQEAGHLTAGAVTSLPMELLPVTEVITVEAGDRDGDRLPDVIALVASGEAGDRLSLVEVRGAQGGEFAADATILWAGTAEASQDADPRPMLSTGDFDADGRMDCAVLSGRGKAISLLWGTGELGDLKFDSDIMSLGAGDLNGDDTSELILGFASQLKIFSFIDRGLAPIEQIEIAGSVGRLTVAEVDGVPPADIFYADLQARNVVLRRPDGGPSIVVVGQLIFNYELADVDLDGRANLIFYAGNSVFVRPTPAETPL